MKNYDTAKIAYDAYCKQTGGKSLISGDYLPAFETLRQDIQDAWWAAADAVHAAGTYETKQYPCGCSATGVRPLPNYCPEHGAA